METELADRPPRARHERDFLFHAWRSIARASAYASKEPGADTQAWRISRESVGSNRLIVFHTGRIRRLLLRKGFDLSRYSGCCGNLVRAGELARTCTGKCERCSPFS